MNKNLESEIEIIHNYILKSNGQHKAPYVVDIRGIDYVIFPKVFNPNYAKGSLLLLDNLGVKKGDRVLDLFTGSGVDANFAVLDGASSAIAIDIFPMPVLCVEYNAHLLGIKDKVGVRQGDLFDALVPSDEKFDLVIANPPFSRKVPNSPSSGIERAIKDGGYVVLKRFWNDVGNYLKDDGRIRIVFSNIGDMKEFHKLAKKNGFAHETIARDRYNHVILEVYEFRRK